MLLVANSPKKPCACHGGLGFLRRRSRGLGDALASLPAGTQLVYTATLAPGFFMGPLTSFADIVAQVKANIGQNAGIVVIGTNASSNPIGATNAVTVTVQLTQPYTNQQMVQDVLDSAFNGTSVNVESSGISATSIPGAGATTTLPGLNTAPTPETLAAAPSTAPPPAPGTPGTSWFDQDSLGLGLSNATYLLIGGVGVVGLSLVKKFI